MKLRYNFGKGAFWVDATGATPQCKLRHIYTAIGGLTVVYPALGLLKLSTKLTLRHPGPLARISQQLRDKTVGLGMLRFWHS